MFTLEHRVAEGAGSPNGTSPRFERVATPDGEGRVVTEVYGDWTIEAPRHDQNAHYRVFGNVFLREGAHWTLEDSALTLMGEHSRQYRVYWEGGKLTTRRCVVGGLHADGRTAHCNFEVDHGRWEAVDTTVQYCYGISVGGEAEKRGSLEGVRFHAGESPDAIIVSGDAVVSLRESRFPIALGLDVSDGGKAVLDLPTNATLRRTFRAADWLNGSARYVVDLQDSVVPHWFLFVRGLSPEAPEAEVVVERCDNFLLNLLGHDWEGNVKLSPDLSQPLKIGATTIRRGADEVGLRMYGGLYFSGMNDVTISGGGVVAETMCWGGVARFDGGADRKLELKCTTMDCRGEGRIELARVRLGGGAGQIIAEGAGTIVGSDLELSDLLVRTEGSGSVSLTDSDIEGELRFQTMGGEAVVSSKRNPEDARITEEKR